MGCVCSFMRSFRGQAEITPLNVDVNPPLPSLYTPSNPSSSSSSSSLEEPSSPSKNIDLSSSMDITSPVGLFVLNVQSCADVNQIFQDFSHTYNSFYQRYVIFRLCYRDFKHKFRRSSSFTFADCLRELGQRCESVRVRLKLDDQHLQLVYKRDEVREKKWGEYQELLVLLDHFHTLTQHIKDILEQTPKVLQALEDIVNRETAIRNMVAHRVLPAQMITQQLQLVNHNLRKMHALPDSVHIIRQCVQETLQEMVDAAHVFIEAVNNNSEEI